MTITSSRPVLLVGNGWVDRDDLHGYAADKDIIALDGGAHMLDGQNIAPDVIIGDLDSLQNVQKWRGDGICVQYCADQDSTDLDKAMRELDAPFVVVLGVLGDRLDHGLASLASVTRYSLGRNTLLVGREDAVRYVTDDEYRLSIPAGHRFSIWTMQPVQFLHSEGLTYRLDGLCLDPKGMLGTSNQTSAPEQVIHKAPDQAGYFILLAREDAHYLEHPI